MAFAKFLGPKNDVAFLRIFGAEKNIAEKSLIIKIAYDELNKFRWNEEDLVAYKGRIIDLQKGAVILEYKLGLAKEEGIKIGNERRNLLEALYGQ
ncbi:hypothetical protein GO684_02095 [Wolbachia endosymbiont of Litomosoides brasiliensis]|uniref:hypothetical protein n=1 Tax=Wolbachia endosymbiont of Litomosoides brasiliensis TaxID=1812117 RepID=UPI00158D9F50|nr:hypothetical protein [Wolbachia endosymbiont of Litomosoides brasiliensis]